MAVEKTGEFALLKFLKLPPQDKWRKPGFLWSKILFKYRHNSPDSYIYFLCTKASFWSGLILCLAYIASYFLGKEINLGPFSISALSAQPITDMINGFLFYAPKILYFVVIPIFVVYYRANINPREFDVMHGNIDPRWPRLSGSFVGVGLIALSLIAAFGANGPYNFLFNGVITLDGLGGIIAASITMSISIALSANLGIIGVMALWKSFNLP